MYTRTIKSRQLFNLSKDIKIDINNGRMFLYKVNPSSLMEGVAYALYFGSKVYFLNRHGKILVEKKESGEALKIDSLVYFEDFPRPESMANYQNNEA